MKLMLSVLALAMLLINVAYAEVVTIGCATKCDVFFQYALKRVGKIRGVQVKLVDVSKGGPEIEWAKYDAIILPGGADIDPKYYLSKVEPELRDYTQSLDHLVKYSAEGRRRDPIEFGLLEKYFANSELETLPVLGVCRGMQMLAVSQGIPLYVDIKTELGIKNRRYLYDRILMEPGTTLMNELFTKTFKGFKRHHQGIRVSYFQENAARWPQLNVTSYSNSGQVAESLEFMDRPVLGVQFHPENDFGFERNRIFGWLLEKAIEYKSQKLQKF